MTDEPLDVQRYLDLYRAQEPRQAHLLIPEWAKDALDALPEDRRQALLDEIDRIASWHGLRTPTIIEATQTT